MEDFSVSNISYTNKDFTAIFTELLDTVKKLTYRWDPSISNESDPGVILLKTNAIIADKCNYNTDKNILETFPESVTQPQIARQLFAQLGYAMSWYKAASTTISMRWVGEVADQDIPSYNLPMFTMVTNDEGDIVYTFTEDATLVADGTVTTVPALQGVAVNFEVSGETTITSQNLDENNRLYFDDLNVAKNGIFITNVSNNNYSEWKLKDNLSVEELGNRFYSFGVTKDERTCYIEFPIDAETIIGQGINITYIKTDGYNGNIGIRIIEKLYTEVSVTDVNSNNDQTPVTLSNDNFDVTNFVGGIGGEDPEDIDGAFRNYKKTIGTFNTLVSLRDYINAILRTNLVSNGFVCDRTNDIQDTYQIIQNDYDVVSNKTYIEKSEGEDLISAFDLKLYLLQYSYSTDTDDDYNTTFTVLDDTSVVEMEIYENKSIQHDFIDLEEGKIILLKNKYPIVATIVPQYKLTNVQANEVINNIKVALYNNYNSKKLTFGEEIDYNGLYSTMSSADERIKSVILDNIKYTTFAVFIENGQYKELAISDNFRESYVPGSMNGNVFTPDDYTKPNLAKNTSLKYIDQNNQVYIYNGKVYTEYTRLVGGVSRLNVFRDEVYAKCILAGVTPLVEKDTQFGYEITQVEQDTLSDIVSLSSAVTVTISSSENQGKYTVRANEDVQFYSPNLIDDTEYSTYVKYTGTYDAMVSNTEYKIESGQYIIFFWKTSDEDTEYKYIKYGEGTIIKPNFALEAATDSIFTALSDGSGTIYDSDKNEEISSWTTSNHVLTGTNKITTRKFNSADLTYNQYFCTWILNNKTLFGENRYVYRLFDTGETEYVLKSGEYFLYTNSNKTDLSILGAGTRIARSRQDGEQPTGTWICDVLDIEEIAENGIGAINSGNGAQSYWFDWKDLAKQDEITVTEMKQVTCGQDVEIQLQDSQGGSFSVNITETPIDLSGYNIYVNGERLDRIAIAGYGWKAISHLHIQTTPTTPETLLEGQTISYTLDDETTGTISGSGTGAGYTPINILSNVDFSSIGGTNIDTSIMYLNGTTGYLSLYTYNESEFDGGGHPDQVETYSDNKVELTFVKSQYTTHSINFKLPAGSYILPLLNDTAVNNNQYVFSDVSVTQSGSAGGPIGAIYDATVTNFNVPKLWYLKFDSDGTATNISIQVTFNDDEWINPTQKLMVYPIFKYVPAIINNDDFARIAQKVSELDVDHVYDYTYEIDSDVIIEDPLDAYEFFNTNHPFCKYTIGQINTATTDIQVTNKIRS